jgi:hypothetical protein
MDESDARGESVVTATDGVTLQKRLTTDEFRQPTVIYELESQRDHAVEVRVIEPIPSALEPGDVGFLGSADEQHWEINGPKLVLERTLDPGGTYRTGVAARGDRAGAITDLLEAPEFLDVDEAGSERRAGAEGESIGADSGSAGPDTAGPLVERLVDELRDGTVPSETVDALRAELGTPGERPSLETRLAQLQTDVAEVRAYTNAMEAFLDEHGPPNEVIERLDGRVGRLDDRLGEMEREVATPDEDVAAVVERLTGVESRVEALEGEVGRLEDGLPGPDVDRRLEAVESDLADVSEFTTSLKAAFRQ